MGACGEGEGRPQPLGLRGGLGDLPAERTQAPSGERLEPVDGERPLVGRRTDEPIDVGPDDLV